MVRSGTEEGGPKKGPAVAARIIRSSTSRGAAVRALFAALLELEELIPIDAPSARRVALRDHRSALVRAYPELRINDSELAQALAEEDGDGQDY